jgi:hypothetical protein
MNEMCDRVRGTSGQQGGGSIHVGEKDGDRELLLVRMLRRNSTDEMYSKMTVGIASCKREELSPVRDFLFLRAQVYQCIKAPTYQREIYILYSIISSAHSLTVSPSESCTRLVP